MKHLLSRQLVVYHNFFRTIDQEFQNNINKVI